VFGLFAEVDRRKPMTSSPKKLIEVAPPLEAVNKESAWEKSIRRSLLSSRQLAKEEEMA